MTTPNAQTPMGLRFDSISFREGLVGFLPERATFANFAFFCRISNSVGYLYSFLLFYPALS
jgi:hypothetical protein